jgi:multiple sugar transport system substrate-binding protein
MIKSTITMLAAMALITASACSRNEGAPAPTPTPAPTEKAEKAESPKPGPVTIKISGVQADNRKQLVEQVIKPYAAKKFPYMTIEYVVPEKGGIETLVAAGLVPDIVIPGFSNIPALTEMGIPEDLTNMVKSNNLDLSKFDPIALNTVKMHSVQGQLNALPFALNTFALFYNKDIFNRYGIPFPKDGMTWEETIDLAKKVTKMDNGTQYSGLQYSNNNANFARGLALQLVDPKTDKATLNTEQGLKVLNTLQQIYSIPGNQFKGQVLEKFLAGETAMIPWWVDATFIAIDDLLKKGGHLDWDVATYPHYDGLGGKTIEPALDTYVISKTSKVKEEAFKLIAYLSTDPEIQAYMATTAVIPVVQVPDKEKLYASGIPVTKGKNIAGIFKGGFLESHLPTKYDLLAAAAYTKYTKQYTDGLIADPVTALRQAEEEANKAITGAKNK